MTVIELGKSLVHELQRHEADDTLGRWMAHYVAEKLEAAERASGKARKELDRECFEAILQLLEHRNAFPPHIRPFRDFESIFRTLSTLDVNDSAPRYYGSERSNADDSSSTSQWLDIATRIDYAARVLIRYCLAVAAESAADQSSELVALAKVSKSPPPDIEVVKSVSDDVDLFRSKDADRLREMINALDAFTQFAEVLSRQLKAQLGQSVQPEKPKSKGKRTRTPTKSKRTK